MPKYMAPGTAEEIEAAQKRRLAAKIEERRRWTELQNVYARCIALAEDAWKEKLSAAQEAQQALAEEMRDRSVTYHTERDGKEVETDHGIPVPLFTPRDRLQFLKEATTALLIEASRRGLTATPEPKHETPEAAQADDVVEAGLTAEAESLAQAGTRTDAPVPTTDTGPPPVQGTPEPAVPESGASLRVPTAWL